MNNPGIYSLGDFQITVQETQVPDENDPETITDLEGCLALLLVLRFVYGTGGTNVKVYLQTSLDQGTTWFDIACVVFLLANDQRVVNLSALTPKTTPTQVTDASLSDNSSLDGVLGDRFRVKVVSTGTYATNTLVSARIHVR